MRITPLRLVKIIIIVCLCLLTLLQSTGKHGHGSGFRFFFGGTKSIRSSLEFTTIQQTSLYALYAVKDNRRGNMGYPFVRALVIATIRRRPDVRCRFASGTEVGGKYYEFSENHGQVWGGYMINCEIPKNETDVSFIELKTTSKVESPWVKVPIKHEIADEMKIKSEHQLRYSVCLPMLFGDKITSKRFVEFAELNKLIGVDRITIYINDSGIEDSINKTLNYYNREGFLEIVKLTLPVSEKKIWYHGQLISIADCLIRHTGLSQFVAFHDLDEFLVSYKTKNIGDYLNSVLKDRIGSLRVPTTYIKMEDREAPIVLKNIKLSKEKDSKLTKCVLRPEMVFEQGIHHTSRVIQDHYNITSANSEELVLFHYRGKTPGREITYLVDNYGAELKSNYESVVNFLRI